MITNDCGHTQIVEASVKLAIKTTDFTGDFFELAIVNEFNSFVCFSKVVILLRIANRNDTRDLILQKLLICKHIYTKNCTYLEFAQRCSRKITCLLSNVTSRPSFFTLSYYKEALNVERYD